MSVTRLAIERNRVTAVLIGVLLLSGLIAYVDMPQQMDPGFIIRVAQVVTTFPGASPDRVEKLVTDPIEEAVQSIPELDFVSSTSRTGVSIVMVNIREEFKNVRPIWDTLRRKLADVRLPVGTETHINDELGDIFPMLFSMTGDGFSDRELNDIAEIIRDDLLHIDGIAKVEIIGEQDERIFVEYDNARLSQLGLSPQRLQGVLASRNIIKSGGEVDIGPETLVLEPSGSFRSLDELERMLIPLPRGGLVHLGDVTEVSRGYIDPPRGLVTVLGRPALTFAVSISDSHNLVDLGTTVKAFFDALPARYPHGIDFELTYFQPEEVSQKVDEFMNSVLQAVVIVLVVMLLTLGLRTGFVVSTLIPSAMIIAMWVLDLIGETINQMTLASLIIALGLLVDNAIVVSEAILVRISDGMDAVEAAVASAKELQTPLLVSSLTTAAAFLPIFLAESAVGEYTGALFKVVTITLLISWALAITLIPLLSTIFMRPPKRRVEEPFGSRFYRAYRASLKLALKWRWVSLAVTIAVFIASFGLWSRVPQIFFPAEDRAFLMAALNLPAGTSMAATQQMAAQVDHYIEQELRATGERGGVTSWTTFIGESPPAFRLGFAPSPSLGGYCELMIHTTSAPAAREVIGKLHRYAIDAFPDVDTDIRMLSAGPPSGTPVQIRISGTDTDRVFDIVEATQAKLREIPGTQSVSQNWGARVKKLAVTIDESRARRAGVSNDEAAVALNAFVSGMETTRYREGNDSIPVLLRSGAEGRRHLDRLRNISVFSSQSGRSTPLAQIADIALQWEPSAILRRDGYRTVTVLSNVVEGVTAMSVFNAMRPWLEEQQKSWPIGYRWQFGGELESSVKANQSIADKMPIAGLLIVLLLVAQFNSLRKPTIVLSTILLALIGVAIGLVVLDSYFGFMTLLGVVSLAGIVINNAIVLLDRIEIEIAEGTPPPQAIVTAAQQRVRPILLTTATTVASLLPLYLTGGEMWRPMTIAIMFGLIFSTMLTLVVVPVLYSLFYRVK